MVKQINLSDIPEKKMSKAPVVKEDIERFINSGWDACEVDCKEYKNVSSAMGTYQTVIKRLGVNAKAIMRGKRLYLVRT